MTPTNAGLKEIHDVREQLERLTKEIEMGPRQIAARQKSGDARKAELETRRTKLKQMKVAAEQKSLQLKSSEGKIHELEGKLNVITTNREYDALRNQIAADKMANSVLEDEIIEALDGVDAMQADLKRFEQELAVAEAEVAAYSAEVRQREPGLRQQIEELQSRVGDVELILPPEIVPTYRRLVNAYGARALAKVTGKSCGECFVGLTSQTLVELKDGKFKFCTCGRLMYFAEPSQSAEQ
ncbi:MAG: hypothetical protein H7062_21315 [Candidatus Saccharimonas sp.]|nr:hypothetical protein [Planctomycetaceae bacterium]